jgi:hypothetical protein
MNKELFLARGGIGIKSSNDSSNENKTSNSTEILIIIFSILGGVALIVLIYNRKQLIKIFNKKK